MQFLPRSAVSTPAPLQLMEPVDQLAPYLHSLGDIGEALDAFERLADLVLSPKSDLSSSSSPSPSLSSSSSVSSAPLTSSGSICDTREAGHYQLASSPLGSDLACSVGTPYHCPSSPGGLSCISGSQINCCASCTSQWQSIAPPSSSYYSSSSPSSSSSSSCSSSAASTCSTGFSSYHDSDGYLSSGHEESAARGARRRTSGAGAKPKRAGRDEKRRQKNASAADRYRKKMKGRCSGLSAELEREQERNEQLRQSLEAKLVLYGEFADLLAHNTRDEHDWDLAMMGSRSLGNILDNICPLEFAGYKQRAHLVQLLHHFKQIVATKSAPERNQGAQFSTPSAGRDVSEEFECDFYNDRLVL